MRHADWYFDFVSPYSYLGLVRLAELPPDLVIAYRPVLFAGLLEHWGQKGPAEVPPKRRWTYRWCTWSGSRLGVPIRFPASHPFNPLPYLRLAIAAQSTPKVIRRIFDALYSTGADPAAQPTIDALLADLGLTAARVSAQDVKDTLRRNTEEAASRGVFGVPTLVIQNEIFWGADAVDFAKAFLENGSVLHNDEMRRLDTLPFGAARRAAGTP